MSAAHTPAPLISSSPAWLSLVDHAASSEIAQSHLSQLLQDGDRVKAMQAEYDGIILDYSRQKATTNTLNLLFGKGHTGVEGMSGGWNASLD